MSALSHLAPVIPAAIGLVLVTLLLWAFRAIRQRRGRGHQRALEQLCARYALTDRERDIMRLIAQGQQNRDIAATLSITVSTVKKHITRMYRKLEIEGRDDLIAMLAEVDNSPECS